MVARGTVEAHGVVRALCVMEAFGVVGSHGVVEADIELWVHGAVGALGVIGNMCLCSELLMMLSYYTRSGYG